MFDIGFIEIVTISVVALLVLGPDKLPGAIRTAGLWVGRLRRSFNNIKADIEREVGADEIRRQLRNEAIMEKIKSTKSQFTETVNSVKKEADSVKDDFNLKKEFSELSGEQTKASDSSDGEASATQESTERPQVPPPPPPPPPPGTSAAPGGPGEGNSEAVPPPAEHGASAAGDNAPGGPAPTPAQDAPTSGGNEDSKSGDQERTPEQK